MSKKVRCGNIGIDLNQIWFWEHIPSLQEGPRQSKHEYLNLHTSNGDTIIIRKFLPGGEFYQNDPITLEEKVFDKLLEHLYGEFSCNLSE
jgi:hypothetical protein